MYEFLLNERALEWNPKLRWPGAGNSYHTSGCKFPGLPFALSLFEPWNYSSSLFLFRHAGQPLHVGAKEFGTEATELTSLISTRRQVELTLGNSFG